MSDGTPGGDRGAPAVRNGCAGSPSTTVWG